jgi:ribosomal protein S18 acetylase RimI-like enzyme
MIGINPEYQHRGIGRALIEAFHAECKRNNAVMRGVARESDERLNNFLVAMGFRKWDIATYEKH